MQAPLTHFVPAQQGSLPRPSPHGSLTAAHVCVQCFCGEAPKHSYPVQQSFKFSHAASSEPHEALQVEPVKSRPPTQPSPLQQCPLKIQPDDAGAHCHGPHTPFSHH